MRADRVAHPGKRPFADSVADRFAGACDDLDQEAQLGRHAPVVTLLFDEILGEGDAMHG